MDTDIVIVGGGPAGLCMARALHGTGLQIRLVEKAECGTLAEPADDGREIALTHPSRAQLESLGVWDGIDPDTVSELRDAWVFDGESRLPMRIEHRDGGRDQLGWLVANHRIRRAAWEAVRRQPGLELLTGMGVESIEPVSGGRRVVLDTGETIDARLVIAADSRFSNLRRAAGIGARMRDFGRSMLVARIKLDHDHEHVAWEWFAYDRTLALLPLNDRQASCVITLPHERARELAGLAEPEFNRQVSELYRHRLGAVTLVGERQLYPLVGVWPDRMIADRLAVIGDAAVGMHPVTAHGFNLGLKSISSLSDAIHRAVTAGRDFGGREVLSAYQRRHRIASLPLYLATATVVGLYTDNGRPARLLRRSALRIANRVAPFRRAVARQLTGESSRPRRPDL